MKKQPTKQLSGILCRCVNQTYPAMINKEYAKEQKGRVMEAYHDTVHVSVHGRTAKQVKAQYADDPRVKKSWSAIRILELREPEIAEKVKAYHQANLIQLDHSSNTSHSLYA